MVNIKSFERKLEYKVEYKFHKWKKQLLIADKVLTVLIVVLMGVFRPDYVIITAYFLIIPYLLLTQRNILFKHLLVSSVVALYWMLIAKNEYGYNQNFLIIWGINLFPLFSWAGGLFLVYVIYSHYEHILKEQGYIKQILLFIIFYWPMLIAIETIAYHLFNVHNIVAAGYPGLPICDCIHAPCWMQIAYFLMGPFFFTICYQLRLENPHVNIRRKIKRKSA